MQKYFKKTYKKSKNLPKKMRKPRKCANLSKEFKKKGSLMLINHTSFHSVSFILKEQLNFRIMIPLVLVVACPSWGRFKAPFEPK